MLRSNVRGYKAKPCWVGFSNVPKSFRSGNLLDFRGHKVSNGKLTKKHSFDNCGSVHRILIREAGTVAVGTYGKKSHYVQICQLLVLANTLIKDRCLEFHFKVLLDRERGKIAEHCF